MINLGLYMNAKADYTGNNALNKFAVRNIEQLLRLIHAKKLTNLNLKVILARDDAEHRRRTGSFRTTVENHWQGAFEFDPKTVKGLELNGVVGTRAAGGRERLLTKNALSFFLQDLGSTDKNDGNVLVLWGHADGPRGFLFSKIGPRTTMASRDILSPLEVSGALASRGSNMPKLNLVCMDACQGACLEFASVLAPHADYLVASQTPVPGSGWNYESWPTFLDGTVPMDWEKAATKITTDFAKNHGANSAISAIRLNKIDNILNLLGSVTSRFLSDPSASKKLLVAREATRTYDNDRRGLVDFEMLFDNAAGLLGNTPLGRNCKKLSIAMNAAIVTSKVSPDLANRAPMNGCSIFFPTSKSSFGAPWDQITEDIYFTNPGQLADFKKTGWHKLVKSLVQTQANRPPMP